MAIINRTRLKQYLNLHYNVLLIGKHGTSKTVTVNEVFKDAGYKYLYLSASTLDVWTDLVGVPKVVTKDGKSILELIRPEVLAEDSLDAIFFDELNRAPDKVLNAIMELIQFKSINGHKFNKLKVVWGAINPDDDEKTYKVNTIDPAQLDRFHVHYDVPYAVDEDYLIGKYPNIAYAFIAWWNELPIEMKFKVSPRRLDYAMHAFDNGCRLEDFLPIETNVKKLRDSLKSIPFIEKLESIGTEEDANKFLSDINNATKLLELIKVSDEASTSFFKKYSKHLPNELVNSYNQVMNANTNGLQIIDSLQEFIKKLPTTEGASTVVNMINKADFGAIYKNTQLLENDILGLNSINKKLVDKLVKITSSALTIGSINKLPGYMWTSATIGSTNREPTNINLIVKILAKLKLYKPRDIAIINKRLLDSGSTTFDAYI